MSQLNTNIIKGIQDNDDVVIKTNNTTRVTIASGGDVSLPTTTCTSLSAPSVSAVNTCKAWVSFNGTGTPAIRTSYNVSSIEDISVGNYVVVFTQPMIDTNYVIAGHIDGTNSSGTRGTNGFQSANAQVSGAHIFCAYGAHASSNGAAQDPADIGITIFGN